MADGSAPLSAKHLRSVPVEIRVSVGHARPTIAELLALKPEDILTLDRGVQDPVELFIGDRLVAYGELVESEDIKDGGVGVRITAMADVPND